MLFCLRPLLRLLALGSAFAVLPPANATLAWETSTVELTTKPGDAEAVGLFQFTNHGPAPLTITNVQSTCSCTTAALTKRTYAPGESGEIRATFHLGQRVGEQEKHIRVDTDDPAQPHHTLTLRVLIPELLTYTPRLLYWKKDEAPDWKATALKPGTGIALTHLELSQPPPAEIIAEISPAETGPGQLLKIKPATPGQAINVTVAGTAVFADGTRVPFSIYALVR